MARIYVGTYAKYSNGSIAGAWLNLEDYADKGEFLEACAQLHKDESDPELMFQDWEDIPEGFVGESHVSDDVWEWLELSEEARKVWAIYREHVDQSGTFEQAEDNYRGTYTSPADWAEESLEESGIINNVPTELRGYIDFESYARDAKLSGEMHFADVGWREVYVFINR